MTSQIQWEVGCRCIMLWLLGSDLGTSPKYAVAKQCEASEPGDSPCLESMTLVLKPDQSRGSVPGSTKTNSGRESFGSYRQTH